MPDTKSTGELYAQRIDALEQYLALQFKGLEDKFDIQFSGLEGKFDNLSTEATKAIDTLLETTKGQEERLRDVELKQAATANGKARDERLRAVEVDQATVREYVKGHAGVHKAHHETHIKERGALGTWAAVVAGIAGWIGYK